MPAPSPVRAEWAMGARLRPRARLYILTRSSQGKPSPRMGLGDRRRRTHMAQARNAPRHARSASVDPSEVARFTALAERWWDPHGEFGPLHRLNPLRIAYIRD